jgi:hypothetical protein
MLEEKRRYIAKALALLIVALCLLVCGPTPPAKSTIPITPRIVETIEAEQPTGNTVILFGKVIDSETREEIPIAQVLVENDRGTMRFNNPFVISQNDKMAAIDAALEVDLTGQVCSDSLGYLFYSGIGGQVDFIRGAARSKGGKPIIALFVLVIEVWQGVVPLWHFAGAVLLGVIGPSGTWAIAKHYPETDWLAWRLMTMTGGVVALIALFRLVVLLGT